MISKFSEWEKFSASFTPRDVFRAFFNQTSCCKLYTTCDRGSRRMYVGLTFEFWRENGKHRADRIWRGEKGRKPEFEVGGTPGIICMSDEHSAQVAQ